MTTWGQIFIVSLGLTGLIMILDLLRRRKLTVEYSLLWLGIFAVVTVVVTSRRLMSWIAQGVGAIYPVSALTLLGFVFVLGILIYYSHRLSMLTDQMRELIQYVAIMEKRLGDGISNGR